MCGVRPATSNVDVRNYSARCPACAATAAEDVPPDTSAIPTAYQMTPGLLHASSTELVHGAADAAAAAGNNKINPSVDFVSVDRRVEPLCDPIARLRRRMTLPGSAPTDPRHRLTDCPRLELTIDCVAGSSRR